MGRKTSARWLEIRRTDGFWSALAAIVMVALAAVTGMTQRAELALYDAASTATTPPLSELAIIGIDDASLASLGSWPWPRDVHAQLIDQLALAGAKTIVYTPFFTEPPSDRGLAYVRKIQGTLATAGDESPWKAELQRLTANAEIALNTDARLAASIQKAGNVLLASRYATVGAPQPLPPHVYRSTLPDPGLYAVPVQSAVHPLGLIGSGAAGVGHMHALVDADGQVRQVPLLLHYNNRGILSLALQATLHSLRLGTTDLSIQSPPSHGMRLGALEVATDSFAVMRPRMHAASGDSTSIPVTSFASVVAGKVPTSGFKDKIVLVGETSKALIGPSAVRAERAIYPVEILGEAISSLRQGTGIQVPAWADAVSWGAVFGALLYALLIAPRLPSAVGMGVGMTLLLALFSAEWTLLRYSGQWVSLVTAALALLAGTVGLIAHRTLFKSVATAPTSQAAESDRMMGLALQGQGQLDLAFERLRKLPLSDAVLDNLYHLAQDFERKRNFAKARVVYEKILRHDRNYKDARSRYKRVRALAPSTGRSSSRSAPVSLPRAGLQLPGDPAGLIPMLGRYRIDKELGKGAMGVVYLGRDPKIGRMVAIKTLALGQEFEGDALVDARARFFREAETAGRLQHPHIVTIFDAGEEHDLAYIAMELIQGADLTPYCSKHQLLPVPLVLSIAARVANALDYAHAHNVVHRDIKPANIMFDPATDLLKVTDFGIARITDSSKTRTGLVLGTPSFMSPEQLSGKKVDGRSDLYSLGVTLFQLLTGSLPLRGESMMELMHKIASVEPPDVRQLRPELSPAVARVVALALQKRPEARYQTGQQFLRDLQEAASGSASAAINSPTLQAVVYDASRDEKGHDVADFQETLMETPAVLNTAAPPLSGAR